MRTLLALIGGCALGLGALRWQLDSYRKEWDVEQRALATMRSTGATFSVATHTVGPTWLRILAGPGRSKDFERVQGLVFFGSNPTIANQHKINLRYLESILGL